MNVNQETFLERSNGINRQKKLVTAAYVLCISLVIILIVELISSYQKSMSEPHARVDRDTFLISTWISASYFSADYILRDILGYQTQNGAAISVSRNQGIADLIKEKGDIFPYIEGLATFDNNCNFSNTTIALIGDKTSGGYCQQLQKSTDLEITADIVTNRRYKDSDFLVIARSIRDEQGEFLGGALAAIDISYFDDILRKIDIQQDSFITVIDDQSRLLARHPSATSLRGQVMFSERLEQFVSGGNYDNTSRSISPVDGKERITTIRKIADTPFIVAMGISIEQALASWWHKFTTYSISTLIILALLIFLLKNHMQTIRLTQKLARESRHDFLTGLPNRKFFQEASEHAISQVKRNNKPCAFLYIDLDRFKIINDLYGHAAGDKHLKTITQMIKSQIRETDMLARLGGDEFGVLLTNLQSKESALQVIAKINKKLEEPILVNNVEHTTTASIGLSLYNGTATEDDQFESIFNIADAAMYLNKHQKDVN